jgi:hypothetical protein
VRHRTGIRDELFGSPEQTGQEIVPIGETISINNQPFTIVGMFKHYVCVPGKISRRQRPPVRLWKTHSQIFSAPFGCQINFTSVEAALVATDKAGCAGGTLSNHDEAGTKLG